LQTALFASLPSTVHVNASNMCKVMHQYVKDSSYSYWSGLGTNETNDG